MTLNLVLISIPQASILILISENATSCLVCGFLYVKGSRGDKNFGPGDLADDHRVGICTQSKTSALKWPFCDILSTFKSQKVEVDVFGP